MKTKLNKKQILAQIESLKKDHEEWVGMLRVAENALNDVCALSYKEQGQTLHSSYRKIAMNALCCVGFRKLSNKAFPN